MTDELSAVMGHILTDYNALFTSINVLSLAKIFDRNIII